MRFHDSLSLQEARSQFFEGTGFSEEQYENRFVIVKVGPIPVVLPNTKGRQRAVRLHDLHHVLTEYDTTMRGEAEISAWELATGCKDYYAAWVLNGLALLMGLVIAPARVASAFARGLRTRNLYGTVVTDGLLSEPVGAVRQRLGLTRTA